MPCSVRTVIRTDYKFPDLETAQVQCRRDASLPNRVLERLVGCLSSVIVVSGSFPLLSFSCSSRSQRVSSVSVLSSSQNLARFFWGAKVAGRIKSHIVPEFSAFFVWRHAFSEKCS